MTTEETINKWIVPAIKNTWNEKKCEEIMQALEQISDLKEAYNKGYKDGQEAFAYHLELCKDEGNTINIPEGATNGDMIKTLFPNISVYEHENGATYSINNEYNFNSTWWNSSYRKEQE